MKPWQKGYKLEELQQIAGIFREQFKPHTYGAFGMPKERDVATALAAGNLTYTEDAAAIWRAVTTKSSHSDFAQRSIEFKRGDLHVRHIAGSPAGERKLLEHLATSGWLPMIVEAHEERVETVSLLRSMGFAKIATKIAASSDIKGVYIRGEPPSCRISAPLPAADEPGLALLDPGFLSQEQLASVRAEIESYAPAWADHYSSYNKRKSWSAIAIQGFDASDPGFIIKPAEMSKGWKAENPARLDAPCELTSAAEHFPGLLEIVGRIPGEKERVRLMRLTGNGELTRHADITDRELGTADGMVCRLHAPIWTDSECVFRSWDLQGEEQRQSFAAGSLFYLDIRKPHAVRNPSESERIHLVVDCFSTPELREWISAA